MNVLLINFILLLVLGFFCYSFISTEKRVNYFVCISFIILLFPRTFVDIQSVPDLEFYRLGFKQLQSIDFLKVPTSKIYDVKMEEIGFRYLMKISSIVSSSFTFFLFVFGTLWLCGYIRVIKAYSPYIILSIILLTLGAYNQSIFVIRQHLAMVVVFLSYKYVIDKKLIKYLFAIFVAFSLHQTAFIALPLYFLYHIHGKKKALLTLVLISVFLYFSFSYLLKNMGGEMLYGYSSYIESDVQTNATGAILHAIELALFVIMLKKHIFDDGINKLLFISLVLGLIVSTCGIGFNPTGRLAMYYTSISYLTVPIILKYTNNRYIRSIIAVTFVSLFFYMSFFGSGYDSLKNLKINV